jgi:hypothetical protein
VSKDEFLRHMRQSVNKTFDGESRPRETKLQRGDISELFHIPGPG